MPPRLSRESLCSATKQPARQDIKRGRKRLLPPSSLNKAVHLSTGHNVYAHLTLTGVDHAVKLESSLINKTDALCVQLQTRCR